MSLRLFPPPSSIHHTIRLLSTSTTTKPSLFHSPPLDTAIWGSKKINHLKSSDKPDSVLLFLRQTGISESDIRTSVSRYPRILCSNVENSWKTNVAKLQEVGICIKDISYIVSHSHGELKVDFFMWVLGSIENLSLVLKRRTALLHSSLEKLHSTNSQWNKHQEYENPYKEYTANTIF